jgi:hypothetical protein
MPREVGVKQEFQSQPDFSFEAGESVQFPATTFALKAEENPKQSITVPPLVHIFLTLQLHRLASRFPVWLLSSERHRPERKTFPFERK